MNHRRGLIAQIHQLLTIPRWGLADLLYTLLVIVITAGLVNRIDWAIKTPPLPPGWTVVAAPPISPVATDNMTEPPVTPTPITKKSVDDMVVASAEKYGKSDEDINRLRVTLHFHLFKESRYGAVKRCGDSGRACGPLQFWAETFTAYRRVMIAQGHAREIGSRLDLETAIDTTAWALANGRQLAWGPLKRGEIKL
jgi:hypothetical protein